MSDNIINNETKAMIKRKKLETWVFVTFFTKNAEYKQYNNNFPSVTCATALSVIQVRQSNAGLVFSRRYWVCRKVTLSSA